MARERGVDLQLDAGFAGVRGCRQRALERAFDAAKPIVGLGVSPVQAQRHPAAAGRGQPFERRFGQPCRCAGRQRNAQLALDCVRDDLENIGPHERIAAGEDKNRPAVGGNFVDQIESLSGREFPTVTLGNRHRTAVHAGQGAGARHLPNDDTRTVVVDTHGPTVLEVPEEPRKKHIGSPYRSFNKRSHADDATRPGICAANSRNDGVSGVEKHTKRRTGAGVFTMKRSLFLTAALTALTAPAAAAGVPAAAPRMTIDRDAGCTCCEGWAGAMNAAGYHTTIHEIEHAARLAKFAIPAELAGCHTAVAAGYLIKGHVPVEAVAKLLRERPKTRGVALPGMPSGTPGMPGPSSKIDVVFLDDPQRVFFTR